MPDIPTSPDESAEFLDPGTILARVGCRVLIYETDTGAIRLDCLWDSPGRAAAAYANYRCDEDALDPRTGDVIEVPGPRDTATYRVEAVSAGCSDTGWTMNVVRVRQDGSDGEPRAVRLNPNSFTWLSRHAASS